MSDFQIPSIVEIYLHFTPNGLSSMGIDDVGHREDRCCGPPDGLFFVIELNTPNLKAGLCKTYHKYNVTLHQSLGQLAILRPYISCNLKKHKLL